MMDVSSDHWTQHGTPRCPKCDEPMEQFYCQRSLRLLAICVSCFIVEEWRLALRRSNLPDDSDTRVIARSAEQGSAHAGPPTGNG